MFIVFQYSSTYIVKRSIRFHEIPTRILIKIKIKPARWFKWK